MPITTQGEETERMLLLYFLLGKTQDAYLQGLFSAASVGLTQVHGGMQGENVELEGTCKVETKVICSGPCSQSWE